MRAAPAVRLTVLHPPKPARRVIALIAALAAAALVAWGARHWGCTGAVSTLLASAAAIAAFVASLARWPSRALILGWDMRQWTLEPAEGLSAEPLCGDVAVAMDLGGWLLLRFQAERAPRRPRWLALRRAGLEAQWHALRCAVYSPRLAAEGGAAADDRAAPDTHDRP